MERIPMSGSSNPAQQMEPWDGIHDLRRSLTKRKMFNEANALFRVELNRTPLADRESVVKEFLSQIAAIGSNLGRDHMESSVRLQWSASYMELGNAARVIEELTAAEAAFNKWCEEFNITDTWAVPQFHAIKCAELALVFDETEKLRLAEQFMEKFAQKFESSKTGTILSTASESASALYQATGKIEYLEKYFRLHELLEEYDEKVSEDLCELIVHRNYLISLTATILVDRQKSLEWIDGFFERYPYFEAPAELESLHRRRSIILHTLQRFDESKEAEKIADELKGLGPSLGKWMHMNFGTNISDQRKSSNSTRYDDEDEDDEVFFQAWTAVAGDQEKVLNTAINLLHRWVAYDMRTGIVSPLMYQELMGITDGADDIGDAYVQHSDEEVDESVRSTLLAALVPPDAATAEINIERWNLVVDWLSNPPKGQRMKRLFCLFMLREARQYNFSDKHLWDYRIRELEQIIEFHSRLPPRIYEATRTQHNAWLAALASTYMAKVVRTSDLNDPSVYALLLEAEKYCNMAVEDLRGNYQPGPLLMQQRLGAQICLLKITRLEERLAQKVQGETTSTQCEPPDSDRTDNDSESTEDIENAIVALRNLGLEKVRESEEIATASELEASWLDGLAGVKERQSVLEFQLSFWTVHNAIHLLLKEREPTKDTITEIWNWVQKYKARSLARTIGTRTDIPPGLMDQILSSDKARPVFEEMISLQERIEAAPLKARFELRRQLDKTRSQMKKDPILRRLIDLREGSPLDLTDIKAIEEHAEQPVVLVDWYYLPAYPDNTLSRLLLFTVKAGSTPTMDVLTTSIEDVEAWQDWFLNPKQLRMLNTRQAFNEKLASLVAPLLHRSNKGDVLVFCPSAILHRLPLHALHVQVPVPGPDKHQSQPLIYRNPIVYIHSLSLLRSSYSAAQHAQFSPQKVNPQFLAGISEADATAIVNGREHNYTHGRNSIKELAQICNTAPKIDTSASKKDFIDVVTQSRLLHLHTHCNWQFADPLDHHVEFPNTRGGARADEDPNLKLTAKEIFGIRLLSGTHVNLIACQGGLMQVKMGDDVMGLVPALLYSGATSTVSTLWSIADGHGAEFSKQFFKSFLGQCQGESEEREEREAEAEERGDGTASLSSTNSVCFVDIALAMQDAIKKMDPRWDEPLFSWAGFVLHGYWMFSLSLNDAKDLGQGAALLES
jgi:CHAT domain-containing protein